MDPSPDAPRAELVAAWRSGDSARRGSVLDRCRPWLEALARTKLGRTLSGKLDPADLVQQACLEALRSADRFRGESEGELLAWLRTILAHVAAGEQRRYRGGGRDVALEVSLEGELTRTSMRLGDAIAGTGTSPSGGAARAEQDARTARILASLPPDYREVILLRHFEGLDHEQAAARMKRSPGAVRMLWMRALARLGEALAKLEPPGSGAG